MHGSGKPFRRCPRLSPRCSDTALQDATGSLAKSAAGLECPTSEGIAYTTPGTGPRSGMKHFTRLTWVDGLAAEDMYDQPRGFCITSIIEPPETSRGHLLVCLPVRSTPDCYTRGSSQVLKLPQSSPKHAQAPPASTWLVPYFFMSATRSRLSLASCVSMISRN